MAQTADGLAQQAKDLLVSDFNADSKADPIQTVNSILSQLAPTDPAAVLQLASLNPDELIDPVVMAAITKNIYNLIQSSLQDQMTSLQADLATKQQALADQQTALDALNQAIGNIGK